jgi:hypothetical protein
MKSLHPFFFGFSFMRKLFCRPGDAAEIHATAELPSTQ